MKFDDYTKLFEKYQAGKASDEEIAALMSHEDEFEMADISKDKMVAHDRIMGQRILKRLNETNSKYVRWPIPSYELLQNPNLVQNTGY